MAVTHAEMTDGFLNITNAAKFLDISRPTLYKWVEEGKLPKPYKIDGKILFQRSELVQAIKTGSTHYEEKAVA